MIFFILLLGCKRESKEYKKYSYQSKIRTDNQFVKVTLNWFDESSKAGGLVLETYKDDGNLIEVQKYVFYEEKDGQISLSNEFKDKVHTYLLNENEDGSLKVLAIENSKDLLLINLGLKEIVITKQNER